MSLTPSSLRRVLLYSHDTFGLGHLRRNLAIAGALAARRPGVQVVLMTGSSVAERFPLPAELGVVRLPSVVKVGAEEYASKDERWDFDLVRRTRSAVMVDTARRFRPDVFLVDHAPQGMKGELLPVYEALRRHSPATRIVLGLRDVIDEPERVRSVWNDQGVYETLDTVFDRILVYGDERLFDVVSHYDVSTKSAAKLTYCGYVCRMATTSATAATTATAATAAATRRSAAPFILGTAGGGADGTELLEAVLAASDDLGMPSLIVTGPLMAHTDRAALARRAQAQGSMVTDFVADLGEQMASATAVVTMGGYNTLCELVARGAPTVVVPRVHPRREQAIRAELFARRGAVKVVSPGTRLAPRLVKALRETLDTDRHSATGAIRLDGLERVDAAVEEEAHRARRGFAAGPQTTPRALTESVPA